MNKVNTKKLSVIEELTSCIKTFTKTIAQQQKNTNRQEATITKLVSGNTNSGEGATNITGSGGRELKKFKICGKMVMHKEASFLELPENENKSRKGWKSIFNRMKN